MKKRLLIRVCLMLAAIHGLVLSQAEAARISPRNPYRSFNISGINYGSMQWEREHQNRTRSQPAPGRRMIFRRR